MSTVFRLLILALVFVFSASTPAALAQAPIAQTTNGTFSGIQSGQVNKFLGIPYAAPPVGGLRWKAPRPPVASPGVIDADTAKSPCLQISGIFGSSNPQTFGEVIGSEDCLYLNVWAPAGAANRPVVLFVPGGAGVYGTGSLNLYDGSRFAAEANAVYVTINYRLGFLGGFYLPAIQDGDPLDDSGDFAILDIIQALKWVQQNISAFGGDPANVTVAGQSAGCIAIYSLLESPVAAGTFNKALCMSGIEIHTTTSSAEQQATGLVANLLLADGLISNYNDAQAYIQKAGPQAISAYLYGKSGNQILAAQNTPIPGTLGIGTTNLSITQEITDGTVLPTVPNGQSMAPINNKVPVILSTVGNESELLIFFGFTPKGFTQADFWALDESNSTDLQTTDFMPIVPNQAEYYATALAADPLLGADVDNLASTLASQVPAVYRSQFLWADYPSPWVDLFHSFHGLDVLFNFDSWPDNQQSLVNFVPPSPSRAALTQQMGAAVKGFIETGDPNTYLGQYGKYWYPWSQGQQTLLWQ